MQLPETFATDPRNLPTFGKEDVAADAICVDMVKIVRTPSDIRPGTARGSSQNDTQDSSTTNDEGT